MRTISLSLLSLIGLALVATTGCMTVHADVPEDVIRHKMARDEGIELSARCSHEGRSYSEGAMVCMTQQLMSCSPSSVWTRDGDC